MQLSVNHSAKNSASMRDLGLCAGDWVEIRSKEEILRTLDKTGRLDELPFMPQMFNYCGKRLRVFKRAHKTCDTVNDYKGRRMKSAVHLEGVRCDGQAYGGCEAGCLIFWKEAWLKRVPLGNVAASYSATADTSTTEFDARGAQCTEADVLAGTQRLPGGDGSEPAYICQATELPAATEPLPSREWRQYIEDYTSGNVDLARMARGFIYMGYLHGLIRLGIGAGPILRWLYDVFHKLWGGFPFPRRHGKIPDGGKTPTAKLDLQVGECVRVRSYKEILATCDQSNKNRGLTFDAEMVPYCGRTYRVLKRVTKILDEKTGKMQAIKNPCIILEGVVCQSRYSECRLFCPRSIYSYWREIWLERVSESGPSSTSRAPSEPVH
jgi:hypothetical protein